MDEAREACDAPLPTEETRAESQETGPKPESEPLRVDENEFLPKRVNIMDDLLLELQEQITVVEGGKSKKITKQRALLISLVTRSMRRNTTAFNLFWAIFQHYELDQEPDKYLTFFVN